MIVVSNHISQKYYMNSYNILNKCIEKANKED